MILMNSYISLNILIITAYFIFRFFKLNPTFKIKLQYFTLTTFAVIVIISPFFPKSDFTNSTVKIWSAESFRDLEVTLNTPKVQFTEKTSVQIPQELPLYVQIFSLLILLLFSIRLFKEAFTLRQIIKKSYVFKKLGKVIVLINDDIQMPFSFWMPGKYYSVLPASFLNHQTDFKVSLFHELQHHRQGDTQWIYPLIILKSLCYLNPFVHFLAREINETQELACDEQILLTKKVSTENYIGCLLRVAQTAVSKEFYPVCAAGFCFNKGRHILMRRIQMMNSENKKIGTWTKSLTVMLVATVLTVSAYASKNLIQDRRISLEDATQMADVASKNSDFPIVMNEEVLAQLNRYLGTPEGRDFIKSALDRKKDYDQTLKTITKKYHNPSELNAIPIVESGFKNLPQRYSVKSAGLWMFIPDTARKYGMKVGKDYDERLDVVKETEAAHRYLLSNKMLFNDWLLSILAYNVGEGAVEKAIQKHGTRDVWELSKFVNADNNYMAKVMAAIIITKNSEQLD
jgi:beta-lactamase regulating signal transducer with metallopeptidase domain